MDTIIIVGFAVVVVAIVVKRYKPELWSKFMEKFNKWS